MKQGLLSRTDSDLEFKHDLLITKLHYIDYNLK
jgi:hypothetical protein